MKIETKFNIGDDVWMIANNKAEQVGIKSIVINVEEFTKVEYFLSNGNCLAFSEERFFTTKEALLQSL